MSYVLVLVALFAILAGTAGYAAVLSIRALRRGSYLVPAKAEPEPARDEDYLNE
jgi:hypothetical protein